MIEHLYKGPEPFLKEAFRVLSPDGIALIPVPYFHPLRRLKARLGFFQSPKSHTDLHFYQYAFTEKEFKRSFISQGFEVIDRYSYDAYKGVTDEIPGLKWLLSKQIRSTSFDILFRQYLHRSSYICNNLGHMLMLIARKPTA